MHCSLCCMDYYKYVYELRKFIYYKVINDGGYGKFSDHLPERSPQNLKGEVLCSVHYGHIFMRLYPDVSVENKVIVSRNGYKLNHSSLITQMNAIKLNLIGSHNISMNCAVLKYISVKVCL